MFQANICENIYISARSRQPIKLNPLEIENRMDMKKSVGIWFYGKDWQ